MSIPLLVVIRDVLKFADTKREAGAAIVGRKIKVDGKVRVAKKFPVGLMDLFEVAGIDRTSQFCRAPIGFTAFIL